MGEKTDHIELMVQNRKIIKKGSFQVFSLFKRLHISRLSCTLILTAFPGKKNVFYSSYWLKMEIWWVLHCYKFFHVFPLRHMYTTFLCLEMMYLEQISCLEYIFVIFSFNIVHFHALPHKLGLGINYARFTLWVLCSTTQIFNAIGKQLGKICDHFVQSQCEIISTCSLIQTCYTS